MAAAANDTTAPNDSTALNEAQMSFLATMMKNAKTKPDVDWDAVAQELQIAPKSARERFRLLSIKLGWNDGPASPNSPKKPAGVTKRAANKVGAKSAKKGGKGKKSAAKVAQDADDSDELAYNGDNGGDPFKHEKDDCEV